MSVLISVIIPCFNKGQYISEAIESVNQIKTSYQVEYIIVDDGSTEQQTIAILNNLESNGFNVIRQNNMGPAAARNTGLLYSKGKYILPLDCDNKINDPYLIKAIQLLEKNTDIDVVYGNPFFFGKENYYKKLEKFNIYRILEENYIDTCAVIRRSIFDKVKGYDEEINWGHEDWELWLNIFFNGGNFYYLDELCFYYRVTDNSLRLDSAPKTEYSKAYIVKKQCNNLLTFFKNNYWRLEYLKKKKVRASINVLLGRLF